jgi:hypothetical protein
MPGASTTAKNQALDGLSTPSNVLAYVGLSTGDPGVTGANEAAGGGYARQACTWNAASGGTRTNSSALTFATDNIDVISHFFTSTAVTAGTYGLSGALTSTVTAASVTVAAGALTLSA